MHNFPSNRREAITQLHSVTSKKMGMFTDAAEKLKLTGKWVI
jgi:hypothetical protein